jgi:hypothetical protein
MWHAVTSISEFMVQPYRIQEAMKEKQTEMKQEDNKIATRSVSYDQKG